jgi:hypothetical protein
VQVLVNLEYKDKKSGVTASSHGDVFLQGTCKPDRRIQPNLRLHPRIPGQRRRQWNHYKIIANNGSSSCTSTAEVSGVSECKPRRLLHSNPRARVPFQNIKIKELQHESKPKRLGSRQGFVNLYTGLDLDNWQMEFGHDGTGSQRPYSHYDGQSEADVKASTSPKSTATTN